MSVDETEPLDAAARTRVLPSDGKTVVMGEVAKTQVLSGPGSAPSPAKARARAIVAGASLVAVVLGGALAFAVMDASTAPHISTSPSDHEAGLVKRVKSEATPTASILGPSPNPRPDPTPAPAGRANTLPEVLSHDYANLLLSERARRRRTAARNILAHEPRNELPEFLVEIAEMELTSVCPQRRTHVVRLGQIGDLRALPPLERLDAEPRDGCRMFRRFDCLGCLRNELSTTLDTLRAAM